MADFAEGTSPFYDLRNNEVELEVENVSEMTRVPAYMFYGMKNLSYTWIMDEIGAHAFDGCTHLQLPRYMNYITKIEEGAYNGLQSNSMIYLPSTPIDIYDENVFGEAGQNSTFIVMEGDCDANLAYKSAPHWSGFNILSKGDWKQPSQETLVLDEHPTGAGSSVSSSLGEITKIATCDDPTFTIVVRDDAEAKCKDAGGNVTIIPFGYIMYNGEKVYKRTATFEQKDNEEKVYIVYTADVPDAVENVAGKNTQYRKVVRNGMILIERDGKIYNLLGAEM